MKKAELEKELVKARARAKRWKTSAIQHRFLGRWRTDELIPLREERTLLGHEVSHLKYLIESKNW